MISYVVGKEYDINIHAQFDGITRQSDMDYGEVCEKVRNANDILRGILLWNIAPQVEGPYAASDRYAIPTQFGISIQGSIISEKEPEVLIAYLFDALVVACHEAGISKMFHPYSEEAKCQIAAQEVQNRHCLQLAKDPMPDLTSRYNAAVRDFHEQRRKEQVV